MGRLGRVQKWILRAAWDNDASGGEPDLFYAEIMAKCFGMPCTRDPRSEWGHKFAKSKLKNYAKVNATVSRAVHLLADRGLVKVTLVSVDAADRSRLPTEEEQQEIENEIEAMTPDQFIAWIELRGRPSYREEPMSRASFGWHSSARYGCRVDLDPTKGRAEIRLTEAGVAVAKMLINPSKGKKVANRAK
jgi:hypothetical protein